MSKPWLNFYDDEVPNELVIPPLTLPDLLRNAANNYPNQIATIYMGGQLTYRQLQQEVEKLAAGLYHLGISKGDRVAIMMPNCPQCIIAYYAVVSLGEIGRAHV